MSFRKCTTRKNICMGFRRIKEAACQLLCSSLLFSFRELNRFLEISVRDPRKFFRASRNSKLDPQNSILDARKLKLKPRNLILDSRKLPESRIEFQVETVNLPLSGTVSVEYCIQLFRQRWSHKSVKVYATMPIGIMGRQSLAWIN